MSAKINTNVGAEVHTRPRRANGADFFCGFLAGVLLTRILRLAHSQPSRTRPIVDHLDSVLKLTAGQKNQIREIIEEARRSYAAPVQTLRQGRDDNRLIEIRRATRKRVREILTAGQRDAFDEWARRRNAARAELQGSIDLSRIPARKGVA